jgi:hypothetical protein
MRLLADGERCYFWAMFRQISLAASAFLLFVGAASAQTITIDGVTDRSTYTDVAAFRVQTNVGFTYLVTLNGVPVPAGVTNRTTKMDYYDLAVRRTNTSDSSVTNVLVRFIVLSSNRGSPELGLIEWTPYPPINSTAAEFAGAHLEIVAPKDFPQGLDIPIVARAVDNADNERRANGWVSASGFEPYAFRLLRGHGHGFLPKATNSGTINYNAQISSLQSNKQINIEPSTTWTSLGGALNGTLTGTNIWTTNSRISLTGHVSVASDSLLRVQEGTVVRCMPGVTITNLGKIWIEGTTERPVVFTATNRVAPEVKAGAWGGFWMRTNGPTAEFIANGAIMTGAGASSSVSFAPGSSHKSDQALLHLQSTNGGRAFLTNCYLINNAGQIANGYFFDITFDHCLLQRAITAGESVGGTIIVNHSAIIEFPSIDGVVNAAISDGDYDAIYFQKGTHIVQNSLVGFCKDDAIDSGSGTPGAGTVVVSNCWIESALHEANAWSGDGRFTWTYDTVMLNCGQGLECGWSVGTNSPEVYADRIFSTGNSIGTRYGDNYPGTTGLGLKSGDLNVSNSFFIYNYRDVFGRPWDDTWNWRTNDMNVFNNFLTASNSFHPNNTVWNPTADAYRLAPYMRTPPGALVGIGLANWFPVTPASLTNGVPVRLSTFTTNVVSVEYAIETPGSTLASGMLTFMPGETVKNIFANPSVLGGASTWRVSLQNPSGGELTSASATYVLPAIQQTSAPPTALITSNSNWKYLDDGSNQGVVWRGTNFNDTTWSNGVAQLGFGDGDENVNGRIRRTNTVTGMTNITFYFRRAFNVTNAATFANLSMWMLRDDGGVVYINSNEVYRSISMPPAPATITYTTFANNQGAAPADNTVDTATLANALVPGTNVVAVEIHQYDLGSSDLSFDFALTGNAAPAPARLAAVQFGNQLVLYWSSAGYVLEQANQVTGPWTFLAGEGPMTVDLNAAQKFFRLKKL